MTNDANPLARISVPSSERLLYCRSSVFSSVNKGSAFCEANHLRCSPSAVLETQWFDPKIHRENFFGRRWRQTTMVIQAGMFSDLSRGNLSPSVHGLHLIYVQRPRRFDMVPRFLDLVCHAMPMSDGREKHGLELLFIHITDSQNEACMKSHLMTDCTTLWFHKFYSFGDKFCLTSRVQLTRHGTAQQNTPREKRKDNLFHNV